MAANYYVIATDYGRSLLAQAHENQGIQLKNIVIGDANGVPFSPESRQNTTALVNQRASVAIERIEVIDATTVRIQATLSSRIGGFAMHEIGITDVHDKLVYIGNFHGNYKPIFTEGASSDMTLNIDIKIDTTAVIQLAPHDSILANQNWVNQQLQSMREYYDEQLRIERERIVEDIPVGGLFLTTLDFQTGEQVAQHKRFGKWERFGDGQAIVAMRHTTTVKGYEWLNNIGATGGAYTHQLSLGEMPEHKHSQNETFDKFGSRASESGLGTAGSVDRANPQSEYGIGDVNQQWTQATEQYRGENQAHNNVQPSIVVGVWVRLPDTAVQYDGTAKYDGVAKYG